MGQISFTVRALEKLPVPSRRPAVYRDSAVRGLGLKIEPSGHRAFFWSRRVNRRLAWKTIGEFESVSIEDARAKASEYNTRAAKWKQDGCQGEDPFVSPHGLTLGEAVAAYTDRHIRVRAKKPEAAAKAVEQQMARYCATWKDRRLSEIRRGDVAALHEKIKRDHSVYPANRLIQMLRAAINWSIAADLWQGANPAKGIKLFREEKRRRFLLAPELAALKTALEKAKSSDLRDFVLLALFSGARKSDVMSMAWRDVSLEHALWTVPTPKNQEPYHVALPTEAVRILTERRMRAEAFARKQRR
jgi:integrase